MATWKRHAGAVLLTAAATALVTGISAAAAVAVNTTFTVTPGGSITVASRSVVLLDSATGATLSCTSSSGAGGLSSGASPPDGILGTITALTLAGCTGPQGQALTITLDRFPFYLGAKTYNATTGVTHGIVYKAHGEVSGPGCTATLAGPPAPGGGIRDARFKFTYGNTSGKLKLLNDPGWLQIINVSGCTGLFNNGATPDPASLTGAYTVSPRQTITSP